MAGALSELIQSLRRDASAGDDIVPILQAIYSNYGDAGAKALLVMPDLPQEAGQAKYMITHSLEKLGVEKHLSILLDQLPQMETSCPQFMSFLLRRILRSSTASDRLSVRVAEASLASRATLRVFCHTASKDMTESPEFRDKCMALARHLD